MKLRCFFCNACVRYPYKTILCPSPRQISTKSMLPAFYSRWRHCTQNATQWRERGEMSVGQLLNPPVPLMYFYPVYFLLPFNDEWCELHGGRQPVRTSGVFRTVTERKWTCFDVSLWRFLVTFFIYLKSRRLCNPLIVSHCVTASLHNDYRKRSFIIINIPHI